MKVTPEIVDVIFKCFDEINSVIGSVSAGEEPTQDLSWIISEITRISETQQPEDKKAEAPSPKAPEREAVSVPQTVLDAGDARNIREGLERGIACYEVTAFIDPSAQMKWIKGQLVLGNIERIGSVVKALPSIETLSDDDSGNVFKLIILSVRSRDEIVRSCDVDQITRVIIRNITLEKKDGRNVMKFSPAEEIRLSEEEQPSAVKPSARGEKKSAPKKEAEPVYRDSDEDSGDDREERAGEHGGRRTPVLKTVKVSIDKLDQLLNNVGELVIANSGFYRLYEEIRKTSTDKSLANEFKSRMEQMSRIAKDLQAGIMKTRMVPIGQVFTRFNRLVRDLAKEHNKKIELVIKGEDTELDKKVIDAIGEPLMHLLRNAIDHGIESADDRKKRGKPEVAHVTLNAYQGGNQIFVEVSDDGRGLDVELIRKKVIEKNLATFEALANMDSNDIFSFIFVPGFSTAEKITDISGRGVGMNVVKEIVSELNGNVSIETEFGMGTRFVMAFPLTLAIIPAIMTRVKREMYAIPLSDVNETIKISQSDITTIEGHEVINLRGEILSLLRLSLFVGTKSALKNEDKIPVVIVAYGNRKIGLMVDSLEGKLEIVIKSLEQNYKTVPGLAGASILGDGSICLILDVAAMINKAIADQDRISRRERENLLQSEAVVEEVSEIGNFTPEEPARPVVTETLLAIEDRSPNAAESPVSPVKSGIREPEKTEIPFIEVRPVTPEESAGGDEKRPSREEPLRVEAMPVEDRTPRAASDKPLSGLPSIEEIMTPVQAAPEESVEERVSAALDGFREELKQNIETAIGSGGASDHMTAALDLSPESLKDFQLLANIGAANAAESLSKILHKRIDLSIPEVNVWPTEKIPEKIGAIDSAYIGVMMPFQGEAGGTMLFIIDENVGFSLIDMLYGSSTKEARTLDEDGESALKEITNIVGSSVLNVVAEKTGLAIKPDVPLIVHDYMQSILDTVLVKFNMTNDYAIVMDTAFYFEDDQVIGNLMLLPEAESARDIANKLKVAHV
jgi:two-component system chemotaxis sensor kinase CheA